nr:MAG TPA: hypothetical protein [Caudoviricetes sp.]
MKLPTMCSKHPNTIPNARERKKRMKNEIENHT